MPMSVADTNSRATALQRLILELRETAEKDGPSEEWRDGAVELSKFLGMTYPL